MEYGGCTPGRCHASGDTNLGKELTKDATTVRSRSVRKTAIIYSIGQGVVAPEKRTTFPLSIRPSDSIASETVPSR